MNAIQLEFPINDETEFEIKIGYMQKQIDEMNESFGRVRKKLFSQVGEIQKLCLYLQNENQELKLKVKGLSNEKTQWTYGKEDCLFDDK